MTTKKEDKVCPKCGNFDEYTIDETFSHLDDFFLFEYQCRLCRCFWSRVFSYIGIHVRNEKKYQKFLKETYDN